MGKRYVIVANGILEEGIVQEIRPTDVVIGVDRAAWWLIAHNIIPHTAVGDFDSVSTREMAVIEKHVADIRRFPPKKDFTDTELAVEYALSKKPGSIAIYGGSGTRLDHELGVLHLLEVCHAHRVPAQFLNRTNDARVVGRGRTILTKREGYRYVSIIPITNTIQITLKKFKYNLRKSTIRRGQTVGISNEFIQTKAEITVYAGIVLIIQSKD